MQAQLSRSTNCDKRLNITRLDLSDGFAIFISSISEYRVRFTDQTLDFIHDRNEFVRIAGALRYTGSEDQLSAIRIHASLRIISLTIFRALVLAHDAAFRIDQIGLFLRPGRR
jgi:hypothetical protein